MTKYRNEHLNETSKGRNGGPKMAPQKAEPKNKQPLSRPPLQISLDKEKTGDCLQVPQAVAPYEETVRQQSLTSFEYWETRELLFCSDCSRNI